VPLSDLEAKYFAASNYAADAPQKANPPIYRGNTLVEPMIEGAVYFPAIHDAISATNAGDAVYIVGWRFNPAINLVTGQLVSLSSGLGIGNLLATKAAAGVDVRLVLNGTLALFWVPLPWAESLRNAEVLRKLLPSNQTTPPLAGRVLFDWSGANQTGSQHQKATVVRIGTNVTAFVGGMDMQPNFWDTAKHEKLEIPDTTPKRWWGWHDVGVRLDGEAAKRVLHNFRCRWHEASTLPEKSYKFRPGDETESALPFNPPPMIPPPTAATMQPDAPLIAEQSLQVLRSRFKWKIPNRCGSGGVPWSGLPDEPATGGFFEIFATMRKAIAAATKYIYIEDQFLSDSLPGGQSVVQLDGLNGFDHSLYSELLTALNAPNALHLHLIFVGSGRKDPEDPGATLKNQTITSGIQRILDGLPQERRVNVSVWRRDGITVHSKIMLIDDEFMSVGSANFQSRSMVGVDNELHVAVVAEDNLVRDVRCALWAEHFNLNRFMDDPADPTSVGVPGVRSGLENAAIALGLWNEAWYVTDMEYWSNRTGYNGSTGYGGLLSLVPPA
jgi:phosphatidylserine/phosphatidylglycerophosphate/cardiolipin synthase-like enzyme